ncbi:MAG: radical SAM protein [Leptospiraceae bacterium]|nr:radical SAM protein [Leptospiraceae bacterium]MCP5500730.1 radical SAM protein [Leptospiraceae bacterium]
MKPQTNLLEKNASALTWADEERNPQDPVEVFAAGIRNHNLANTAYPIAHRKTIWDYKVSEERYEELLSSSFRAFEEIGLYMHIPFCEAKCRYCEYTVVTGTQREGRLSYLEALQEELYFYGNLLGPKELVGLDIGGGTPSLLETEDVVKLIKAMDANFIRKEGFSISIETTPKLAAELPDRIKDFREAGIDRISMGLQTVNPDMLRRYGRELNRVDYNTLAVRNIRKAGFNRFNVDLMYGFAKQSPEDFLQTVEHAIRLEPEYITLYRMRYKGTLVSKEAAEVELDRVNDMYNKGRELMAKHGYLANPGKNTFSRVYTEIGTSAYLTERVSKATPYLGTGLGAQTFTCNLLAYNQGAASKKMNRYIESIQEKKAPIQDLYLLPPGEGMAKMIAVSFYFGEINTKAFIDKFGVSFEKRFAPELDFIREEGLMKKEGDYFSLTKKGANYFNGVIALFYSDRVKEHLISL